MRVNGDSCDRFVGGTCLIFAPHVDGSLLITHDLMRMVKELAVEQVLKEMIKYSFEKTTSNFYMQYG